MMARFKPTRAGILNLWDYRREEFAFADGRLVLRGANGSGKTKALEVLFPFVLDGRLDPRRLDPFSGESRTMRQNLLWRGQEASLGYVWMEFLAGEAAVTIGIGLRAQKATERVETWFFVTDRRMGDGLELVDAEDRPLTRRALVEALGVEAVHERASDYRKAVDARLFGLGERYEAMLDLVLTLRRPQLAKDLDPKKLSQVLAEGLPPVDERILDDAAHAFDDLEAVQRIVERLRGADQAVQGFLGAYFGYVRSQARGRVDALRAAEVEVARLAATLAERERVERAAIAAVEACREAARLLASELAATQATVEALKSTEGYRAHGQIQDVARGAQKAREQAGKRHAALAAAESEFSRRTKLRDELQEKLRRASALLDQARSRLLESAARAGIPWAPEEGFAEPDRMRTMLRGRASARDQDRREVTQALKSVENSLSALAVAEQALLGAQERLLRAEEASRAAELGLERARAALLTALLGWVATQGGLVDPGVGEGLIAAVEGLDEPGVLPLAARWDAATRDQRDLALQERHGAETEWKRLEALLVELRHRREEIAAERDDAPPPLMTRPAPRLERPGAPLWRLVRFREEVPVAAQGGIEAALEAAGILDAWVDPAGAAAEVEDAFLRPSPSEGLTLGALLLPEPDGPVSVELVERVLSSLRLDGGPFGVEPSGRFVLGPLTGRLKRAAPLYIGATARERRRRERLSLIAAEIIGVEAERAQAAARVEEALRWLGRLDAARAALPTEKPLHRARQARDGAAAKVAAERTACDAAQEAADTKKRQLLSATNALAREAATRGTPSDAAGLEELGLAIRFFGEEGERVLVAIREVGALVQATRAAEGEVTRQGEALEGARLEEQEASEQAAGEEARLAALRTALGAEATRVLADIEAAEESLRALRLQDRRQRERMEEVICVQGDAGGERKRAEDALGRERLGLVGLASRLRVFGRAELAEIAEVEADVANAVLAGAPFDGPAFVALAASLDQATRGLSGAEERRKATRTQVQNQYEELARRLGATWRPAQDLDDEIVLVTIADAEGRSGVAAFGGRLHRDLAEQEAMLSAKERALFEDAMLGAVCRAIHQRVREARRLVEVMDAAMRGRRLSSGRTVSVSWVLDDEADTEDREVFRVLETDPTHLGPDALDRLRSYFSARVQRARRADPMRSWREILAEQLDYRRWREFRLWLVRAHEKDQRLTPQVHAGLSGGEKAAALHLPLFAAAHALFAGARPDCPRLIALDEAFAGIDDLGRPELLSLAVRFDLDLFMTGYDLWITWPCVPAVAHYDLQHLRDEHVVAMVRIDWNGRELVEV
jgi:uncharacterized protein (TIGR02680 family)